MSFTDSFISSFSTLIYNDKFWQGIVKGISELDGQDDVDSQIELADCYTNSQGLYTFIQSSGYAFDFD